MLKLWMINRKWGDFMKLYEVLSILDSLFTPNTTEFSDYAKWTSDDNGFLRTCFCRKRNILKNRNIGRDVTHIVVGCETRLDRNNLVCKWVNDPFEYEETMFKMQICFDSFEGLEDEVEWNGEMGYRYCYIIDLENKSMTFVKCERY